MKSITLLIAGIAGALTIPQSSAAPARKVSYEPPLGEAAASRAPNLLRGAKSTASGHWDKFAPDLAIDGDRSPDSHWAAENLPVWHQVDLGAAKTMSALHVWPYWDGGRVYQCYLRTTFLGNSRGKENGGHLVEIEAYAAVPQTGLEGGVGTIDLRYPPTGTADVQPADTGVFLTAWRGERVSAQVVVTSGAHQTNLHVEAATLKNGSQEIPVKWNFVRYTLADGKPQGDILDSATNLPLAAGSNRPIWLSIDVPGDAAPGSYTGAVTVRSDGGTIEFPVKLDVLAAKLPPPAEWKYHVDLWQHPISTARWHDVQPWSEEHFALLKPEMKRLAEAGQKAITCTLIDEAWGGQTYDNFPSMIQWTRKADGSWSYDYSIFDKWVSFMIDEVGMKNARIHCYTMIPWSLKFGYYDEKTKRNADIALQPGSAHRPFARERLARSHADRHG